MSKYTLFSVLFISCTSIYGQAAFDLSKQNGWQIDSVPKKHKRSFETDRPDVTESPYTVDVGYFQFETDLFKNGRTIVNGVRNVENSFNVFNIKAGITHSLDIQFIAESLVISKEMNSHSPKTKSSLNTITFRMKQNLWGNDRGKTAMAMIPFIHLPANHNTKITGGCAFPLSISLPGNWSLGSQIQIDFVENQRRNGYHMNPSFTTTTGHQLIGNLNFFSEILITNEREMREYACFFNSGLVYNLKENVKLDAGIYHGLANTTSNVWFAGLSFRI